ncbi:hypothetical protein MUP77_18800 [Candidatus Bathyarchaeota archaeon]|nr:hypothetical protein [Candidatus Bathyarchaeota archaeon]
MLEKLREILGLISGYKQRYDALKAERDQATATIAEAEPIVDNILTLAKGLSGTDSSKTQ